MHTIAFAAGQRAHLPLLLGPLEVEPRDVGTRRHRALADEQLIFPARDLLPHALVRAEGVAALIDVSELHRLAQAQRAAIGLLLSGHHPEQRRLAGAIRPDHADDAAPWQCEPE